MQKTSFTMTTLEDNRLFLVIFQLVFSNDANCLSGIFNVRERLHFGGKQDVPGHFSTSI